MAKSIAQLIVGIPKDGFRHENFGCGYLRYDV
jgi:hypothetical protein